MFSNWRRRGTGCANGARATQQPLRLETLEERCVPATIVWMNRLAQTDQFTPAERAVVDQAINVWQQVIVDFHNDNNNTIELTISGGTQSGLDLGGETLGLAGPDDFDSNFRPTRGSVQLDADGGGGGWFIDPTPADNAEFSEALSTAHFGSGPAGSDMYSTALHEIGHALGFIDATQAWAGRFTAGPGTLQTFSGADSLTAQFVADRSHLSTDGQPHDLMTDSQFDGERKLPSDLDARILADVYGYTISLATDATLRFSVGSVSVNEAGGTATLTVTRNGNTTGEALVSYATADAGATAGSDYTSTSGTLTFPSGGVSQTITVPLLDDGELDPAETFAVVLSEPVGARLTAPSTVTVQLNDDESAGVFGFSQAVYRLAENAAAAVITVTRTEGTAGGVVLSYATSNGTAVAGTDYTATSGTLTFGAAEMSQSFTVPLLDNAVVDGRKTVLLTLTTDDGTGQTATLDQAQVLLVDNDGTLNQRFVANAYLDLLERPVDPAGLQYWSGLLEQGLPRFDLTRVLMQTDEFLRTHIIDPAYQRYLGRTADAAGAAFWADQLRAGLSGERLEAILLGSGEFFTQMGGDNASYLQALYQSTLGRDADPDGQEFWLPALGNGLDRTALAALFVASDERHFGQVEADYQFYLGRSAGPVEAEFWVGAFPLGVTRDLLDALLLASDEYLENRTRVD